MFELWNLMEQACSKSAMHFAFCNNYKPTESVWRIPFKESFSQLIEEMHLMGQSADLYITIFWLLIIFGFVGLLSGCYELKQIAEDENYEPKTFGSRSYEYITMRFRRKARVIGTALNIKLYSFLVYGMFFNRAFFISPWVLIYTFVIPIEIFYWFFDVIFKEIYDLSNAFRLISLIIRWGLTIHILATVRNIEEH